MFKKIITVFVIAVLFLFAGCSDKIAADDLMGDITAAAVNAKTPDDTFIDAAADFSVGLFKKTLSETNNSLISPTSVLLALSMTANGADNATLSQMEAVLGGGLSIGELNEYLYSYVKGLPSGEKSKLNIANSIWFRENGFAPNRDFLQTNADYYGAAAYKAPFDGRTVKDINLWVKNATDGLIDNVIKEIPAETIMYLINTVLFDAEWQSIYEKNAVRDREFTAFNGAKQTVKFMNSSESKYLAGGGAAGFIKPYFGNKYSFVALLPDESISINDYAAALTGEGFMNIIKNASVEKVVTAMPKFEYDYEIEMNGALMAMGMTDAFYPGNADFSKIGTADGNIFISQVLHKTFITVDERGTKAGAVTVVSEGATSAEPQQPKIVILDRPFVYAIIDNATNLPIFMGTLMTCK